MHWKVMSERHHGSIGGGADGCGLDSDRDVEAGNLSDWWRRSWLRRQGCKDLLSPPDGYVVSFVHFHERGFTTPAHKFLRGLLHYYKIELQHLNPNGI